MFGMPTKNDVFFFSWLRKRHYFWWVSQTNIRLFLFRQDFSNYSFVHVMICPDFLVPSHQILVTPELYEKLYLWSGLAITN